MVSQSIGPRIYSAINRHLVDTDSPDFAEGSDFDFEYDGGKILLIEVPIQPKRILSHPQILVEWTSPSMNKGKAYLVDQSPGPLKWKQWGLWNLPYEQQGLRARLKGVQDSRRRLRRRRRLNCHWGIIISKKESLAEWGFWRIGFLPRTSISLSSSSSCFSSCSSFCSCCLSRVVKTPIKHQKRSLLFSNSLSLS